jgi:hypothetical protein
MSEETPQPAPVTYTSSRDSGDKVAIIAIVMTALVVLACILACAVMAYAFLSNPPW